MRTNRPIRHRIGVTLSALTVVAVTGCGGDADQDTATTNEGVQATTTTAPATGSSAEATDTAHNDADATFAQSMIMHHRQAMEMATMGETRATDPEIKALAGKIKAAQSSEVDQMTGWLGDWGAPMPSAAAGGHGMPGMSGSDMPGMMSEKEMASLKKAKGAEFDSMFLEMMIAHHKGAVEMATTQEKQGQNATAKALAATMKTDQDAEIKQMEALLVKL